MNHDLQAIETAIKHFCYQNGIDYTTIYVRMEGVDTVIGVDTARVSDNQIKMIENYLKELQGIGKDPEALAHVGGGFSLPDPDTGVLKDMRPRIEETMTKEQLQHSLNQKKQEVSLKTEKTRLKYLRQCLCKKKKGGKYAALQDHLHTLTLVLQFLEENQ